MNTKNFTYQNVTAASLENVADLIAGLAYSYDFITIGQEGDVISHVANMIADVLEGVRPVSSRLTISKQGKPDTFVVSFSRDNDGRVSVHEVATMSEVFPL